MKLNMKLLNLSALVCLALLHSCSAFSWKPCEDAESKSSVNTVSLSPESPYPGSTAEFRIDATAGEVMHLVLTGRHCSVRDINYSVG